MKEQIIEMLEKVFSEMENLRAENIALLEEVAKFAKNPNPVSEEIQKEVANLRASLSDIMHGLEENRNEATQAAADARRYAEKAEKAAGDAEEAAREAESFADDAQSRAEDAQDNLSEAEEAAKTAQTALNSINAQETRLSEIEENIEDILRKIAEHL